VLSIPLFIWAARRWPVLRPVSRRAIAIQALLVLLVSAASIGALYGITRINMPRLRIMPFYFTFFRAAATVPMIVGVAILGQAIELRARVQRNALDAERLRARLADARLASLTAQLRPHFLFNTLQNVSTLMYQQPAAADALLGHLGQLLRASFRYADTRTIPLEEELRLVRDYVEIARVRHGERLHFELDFDGAAADAAVPPFLLQPIVENAIAHGFDHSERGVHITVRARSSAETLCISVSDSGRGAGEHTATGAGIGLRNTRERLTETFGASATLSLQPLPDGGTVVEVRMPLKTVHEVAL
jgi:sensor histidine kinase YesM